MQGPHSHTEALRAQFITLNSNVAVLRESIFVTDNEFSDEKNLTCKYKRDLLGFFSSFVTRNLADPTNIQNKLLSFFEQQKKIYQPTLNDDLFDRDDEELSYAVENYQLLEKMIDIAQEKFSSVHSPLPQKDSSLRDKLSNLVKTLVEDPDYDQMIADLKKGITPNPNSSKGKKLFRLVEIFNKFESVPALLNFTEPSQKFNRLRVMAKAKTIADKVETSLESVKHLALSEKKLEDFTDLLKSLSSECKKSAITPTVEASRISDLYDFRDKVIEISKIPGFAKLYPKFQRAMDIFYSKASIGYNDLTDDLKLYVLKMLPTNDLIEVSREANLSDQQAWQPIFVEHFTNLYSRAHDAVKEIAETDYLKRNIESPFDFKKEKKVPANLEGEVVPDWQQLRSKLYDIVLEMNQNLPLLEECAKRFEVQTRIKINEFAKEIVSQGDKLSPTEIAEKSNNIQSLSKKVLIANKKLELLQHAVTYIKALDPANPLDYMTLAVLGELKSVLYHVIQGNGLNIKL